MSTDRKAGTYQAAGRKAIGTAVISQPFAGLTRNQRWCLGGQFSKQLPYNDGGGGSFFLGGDVTPKTAMGFSELLPSPTTSDGLRPFSVMMCDD
jgi:hypothetical protein